MAEPDFELVAASLRADTSDLEAYLEALATKLQRALPGRADVKRRGLLGPRPVHRVTVRLDEARYELVHDRGRVECGRSKIVRGIALSRDELTLGGWIDELSRELVAAAEASERGREALERLLRA